MAYISPARTTLGVKPAPTIMADFSGRGPNTIEESILKVYFSQPRFAI